MQKLHSGKTTICIKKSLFPKQIYVWEERQEAGGLRGIQEKEQN